MSWGTYRSRVGLARLGSFHIGAVGIHLEDLEETRRREFAAQGRSKVYNRFQLAGFRIGSNANLSVADDKNHRGVAGEGALGLKYSGSSMSC